jgi:hypothetical protein
MTGGTRGAFPARAVLMAIMALAFLFGYGDLFLPLNFERLHIFLFNMTSGGFVILFYTRGGRATGPALVAYLVLSIAYAVLAFLELYLPAVVLSFPLWAIVEITRVRRFSFFPLSFFRRAVPLSQKFHEASLLCLSLAFVFSTAVVLNNEVFHRVHCEKLALDVFFLGFSFPVSLITMSIMFHFIEEGGGPVRAAASEALFWIINVGVIVFFIFIIGDLFAAEVAAASVLFAAVIALFALFMKYGRSLQQKQFLVSGMTFLLFTAITGLLYVPAKALYGGEAALPRFLLEGHAYISLYGWNLSGIFVILRWNDFPLRLNSRALIAFHWAVILCAPLGKQFGAAAIVLSAAYIVLLHFFFYLRYDRD